MSSTIAFLYNLQVFGMKFGLRNIRALLRFAGNPEKKFHSIHIAGTNGKGSTSSLIAAVLTAAGYKVGLYTSPHLVRFNERIRINGVMISDVALKKYTNYFRPTIEKNHATFFEATTAIAFQYFADRKIDIAVIETGLGGRLDATNVIRPIVSVITSIGKDHTAILGNTLSSIASEKAGIIKNKITCVVGKLPTTALKVIRAAAQAKKSEFIIANQIKTNNYNIGLHGEFQKHNAMIALQVVRILQSKKFSISNEAIANGLANVAELTKLRGRFEIINRKPVIILDVAHNPDALNAALQTLKSIKHNTLHIVFGVMKDKEYAKMFSILKTVHPTLYLVQPETDRALALSELEKQALAKKIPFRISNSVTEGVQLAISQMKKNDALLITGSFYVVGEALQFFTSNKKNA